MAYHVEQSYNKKAMGILKSVLFIGILLLIIATYFTLMFSAYSSVYPNASFSEIILNGLQMILKKPLYFLPIDYSLNPVFIVDFGILIAVMVLYMTEVNKIHNDVNTLSGSAEWQDAYELTKKYADFE